MNKLEDIVIQEKPDWVSWEDIKECLYNAHAVNRAKGINMTHYLWPVEKIQKSLGNNGVMFVALDDKRVVGTAAIAEKSGNAWYNHGRYAYMCFAGVLSEYNDRGIYKALVCKREVYAQKKGFHVLQLDTHKQNKHLQKIALKNGYRYVRFFLASSNDHYSVVMVKWLNGCPYSNIFCWGKYQWSKLKTIVRTKVSHFKEQ